MRKKSEKTLTQLIERLKAEKLSAAAQLLQVKKSRERDERQQVAEQRRRRGEVLERQQSDRWSKDPIAKAQELRLLDEQLIGAADRAAFGLAPLEPEQVPTPEVNRRPQSVLTEGTQPLPAPERIATDAERDGARQAVKHLRSDDAVAEPLAHSVDSQVAGQDHRAALAATAGELDRIGAERVDGQVANLADDQHKGAA